MKPDTAVAELADPRLRRALAILRRQLVHPPPAATADRHLTAIREELRTSPTTAQRPVRLTGARGARVGSGVRGRGGRSQRARLAAASMRVLAGAAAAAAAASLALTGDLPVEVDQLVAGVARAVGAEAPVDIPDADRTFATAPAAPTTEGPTSGMLARSGPARIGSGAARSGPRSVAPPAPRTSRSTRAHARRTASATAPPPRTRRAETTEGGDRGGSPPLVTAPGCPPTLPTTDPATTQSGGGSPTPTTVAPQDAGDHQPTTGTVAPARQAARADSGAPVTTLEPAETPTPRPADGPTGTPTPAPTSGQPTAGAVPGGDQTGGGCDEPPDGEAADEPTVSLRGSTPVVTPRSLPGYAASPPADPQTSFSTGTSTREPYSVHEPS